MFSDLRQFEFAKEYIGNGDQRNVKQLIRKQAEWCKSTNDPRAAAYAISFFLIEVFHLCC